MTDGDDELAQYAADQELNLYKEYRDVIGLFRYVVETDRRFYLANSVEMVTHHETGDTYFELMLESGRCFADRGAEDIFGSRSRRRNMAPDSTEHFAGRRRPCAPAPPAEKQPNRRVVTVTGFRCPLLQAAPRGEVVFLDHVG